MTKCAPDESSTEQTAYYAYTPISSSIVALRAIMSDENASDRDEETWSDLYDEGLYALRCEEFGEAMRHWSDMFDIIPEKNVHGVMEDLTEIIAAHLCRKVYDAPDCIELDGLDEMAVCMRIASPDMDCRVIPGIIGLMSERIDGEANIAHMTDTVVLCSELAHIELRISCDITSDLEICRSVGAIARSATERITAPPGSMMDEEYVKNSRCIVDYISRLFVLVSEAIDRGISGMGEDDLHSLLFDWMDAPEPDYLQPLDRLFSFAPQSHDVCVAPAEFDERKLRPMADEYVRRFVRGPRKKLLRRGRPFR